MEAEKEQASFFEDLTEIYYRFITEKFSIPPGELDEENFRKHLVKNDVPDEVMQKAILFFNECLTLRYGGLPYGSSRVDLISTCRNIIDELDMSSHHI